MERTEPEVLRTCTVNVSYAVVVVVSAVSMCNQKVKEAAVALEGMVTVWRMESVVVLPCPSSQASNVPECGGSVLVLLMIRFVDADVVTVQGAGLAAPFSNPGLPRTCVVVLPPPEAVTVRATVVV